MKTLRQWLNQSSGSRRNPVDKTLRWIRVAQIAFASLIAFDALLIAVVNLIEDRIGPLIGRHYAGMRLSCFKNLRFLPTGPLWLRAEAVVIPVDPRAAARA